MLTGPLAKALQEWHQLGEWDSRVVHVSDLAVALPMPDGKCPRQLWLRQHAYTVRRSMNTVLRDALAMYRKANPDRLTDKIRRVWGGEV